MEMILGQGGSLPIAPREFIADLTYLNYRHNREVSPEVAPEEWRCVYGPSVDAMEARYQAEMVGDPT